MHAGLIIKVITVCNSKGLDSVTHFRFETMMFFTVMAVEFATCT